MSPLPGNIPGWADRIRHCRDQCDVYLSFLGGIAASKFPMSRDHYLSEQYLKETGIPSTILRDGLYLDLIPEMFNEKGVMRGSASRGEFPGFPAKMWHT